MKGIIKRIGVKRFVNWLDVKRIAKAWQEKTTDGREINGRDINGREINGRETNHE